MKWIHTISVVTPAAATVIRGMNLRARDSLRLERFLCRQLLAGGEEVVFFRSVMDGWDASHKVMCPIIMQKLRSVSRVWRKYVLHGSVLVSARMGAVLNSFESMKEETIISFASRDHYMGAYAAKALLFGIKDAARFAKATRCTLILASRRIGPVCGDDEYRRRRRMVH